MIKTFRGLIAHGAQDTIVLHTNDGSTGYRIVKFQIIPETPGAVSQENIVKIYKIKQTSVDGIINFAENILLGAAFYTAASSASSVGTTTIIFDNDIFNQDIYITNIDVANNEKMNYYIELEQVKLDLGENTVATLKDIRNKAVS